MRTLLTPKLGPLAGSPARQPRWGALALALLLAAGIALISDGVFAQAPSVDSDDIGGIVRGPSGPEAGVWVIAETTDLPTKFRRIVVTDDQGRYVLPDLPKANYRVWARGYGLKDSQPVEAAPGRTLDLTAVKAATPRDAAQYYPANYWYSLVEVPAKTEFPGTGASANGIAAGMRTQAHWIDAMKQGCQLCHQLGNQATRELPPGQTFDSTEQAWARRVLSGQRSAQMGNGLTRFGRERAVKMYADWTDRIMAGEVPPQPPRPQGLERNVVLSLWEWSSQTGYVHDEVASDKRDPTVNANGPVYGVEFAHDGLVFVDPVKNTAHEVKLPLRAPESEVPSFIPQEMPEPSFYWGRELLWKNEANPHNPMMDGNARVWMTHTIRDPAKNPAWCKKGSGNKFGEYFPLERAARHASFYDPKTAKVTMIDTCFNTHHLQATRDDKMLFSTLGTVVGWIDMKVYDATGDEQKAQGWCPTILDTNGDGRIGEYVGPTDPVDPAKDKRIVNGSYGIIENPKDGSIWVADGGVPGHIVRLELGSNPPMTCKAENYEPPFNNPNANVWGFSPRGIDVTTDGIVWTALSGSGHLASFDRSKCKVLNGPTATGQHCPEGWTLYATPGPNFKGVTDHGSADFHYYNWVDQHNTLGLGRNIPIANGSTSDSLLALLPDKAQFVILRVPYPMGFYSRGLDGRVDDPNAGWKGRGVWADFGTNAVWHAEGGKANKGILVKFQVRPDPLAH